MSARPRPSALATVFAAIGLLAIVLIATAALGFWGRLLVEAWSYGYGAIP